MSLTIILNYIFIFSWHRAGKQIKRNVSSGNVFPMVSNVIFMYLKMKSSRVSSNTYNHIFRAQHRPMASCGPWLGPVVGPGSARPAAGQGVGSGELRTGPACSLTGQELTALGAEKGSWAVGRVEEP